ncbi:MAG TPA: sensor histidine kinase KdpD [Elusimicrobia bacterium]|nr:sensor histidine kinase KdpD [Elusimicrobiota bacterium]
MTGNDAIRPDPDELLKSLKKAQAREKGGKLKIFLGMSAGVGKTYAMLEAAHALIKDGADVVAGIVETHKRAETQRLLENLPVIPRKTISYKGKEFDELDIDELLKRKPEFALVDELAHTNIPGSRHEKRWQDIIELLDHGINVYTTINIQHVESRKEDVELATGISIRETVPDSVIELAEQVELVDIPPETLLERLAEGKVYLGEKAIQAADNFFRQDKLTALREIVLRFAGDVVGNELRELSSAGPSAKSAHEKLMVAVSHSPHSRRLIRAARKMAFAAEADWIALHVDTGIILSQEDKNRLSENIELARNLGAAIITTTDADLVSAIARVGKQHGITKMLIGRPRPNFLARMGPSLLNRLLTETDIDIHVLHDKQLLGGSKERFYLPFSRLAGKRPYQSAFILIGAITVLGALLAPAVSYQSIGFLYLLAVLVAGAFFTVGPILLSATLSAVAWNFFFIPPKYTFTITRTEDALMCVTYLLVAAITGLLSHRIIHNQQLLRVKEKSSDAMLDILAQFAFQSKRKECLQTVMDKMRGFFGGSFEVIFAKGEHDFETTTAASYRWMSDAREWAVAKWVMDNGKEAGWSTDTLSSSQALYIPLIAYGKIMGVLAYMPNNSGIPLGEEAKSLMLALCGQIAFYFKQVLYREQAQSAEELKRSEKLYQTILNSVSHEIKTPITAIIGLVSALEDEKIAIDPLARKPILDELSEAAERLNREVTNILDMSRLSSGLLSLKKEWFDVRELAESCVSKLSPRLDTHKLELHIPEKLPFLHADYALMEQVLVNILSNALNYTQPGSRIELSGAQEGDKIVIRVADSGHGIPQEYLNRVFDRFFRVPGTPTGGTGLGLAIAKTVVELHNGSITALNRPDGGAEFSITLPVEPQPNLESK